MEKSIPKTLLVVKNRALGDSVMGLSTLQYLKKEYPNCRIIYAVPTWIKPLYQEVEITADKVIAINLKTAKDWWKTFRLLKEEKIDTVLELFQSGRSAKFFSLWEKLGGPRYVFHNHHEKTGPVHDQGVIKSNIQRDLDGAWTFFGKDKTPPQFLDYPPIMKVPSSDKNQVVLGVVATRQTKMWPLDFYGELTHLLKQTNPQTKILIPLGPGDGEIKKKLLESMHPDCEFLEGPLNELPKVLSGSSQYIGNDTGLKHICVALDIPTFTLFGPEPPTEWHPYSLEKHPIYFREPLECRTRDAHYCGLSTCDSMICLNTFKPEDLMRSAQLDRNSSQR